MKDYKYFNDMYWYVPARNNRSHGLGEFYYFKNDARP